MNASRGGHIAIFVPSLRGGGAERVMVSLANGLSRRGHRVDLVLGSAVGPFLSEVLPGVRLVTFDKRRVLFCLFPIVRYLRRERPDAVLSAMTHANVIMILSHILARCRARLLVSERSSLSILNGDWKCILLRRLIALLYPRADYVISVTKAGERELTDQLSLPSEIVTSIPNPVDIQSLRELSHARPDHPWLASGQPPVILAVGRLVKEKDYSTLLAALARLQLSQPARLVILGEGNLRAELELEIGKRNLTSLVALLGFHVNPFGWMAACTVYVLTSRTEGFPNALVQAMACGARIISTDCATGPSEILEGGKWGQLVSVGDDIALAHAMERALQGPSPPEMSERLTEYETERIVSRYERILLM